MKDLHWFVEAYSTTHENGYPLGTAYCTIAPELKFVDFILVADRNRRIARIATTAMEEAGRADTVPSRGSSARD